MRTASGVRSWLRRSSSTPVMPGMRWSVTMTATSGSAASRARASSPWPARSTRNSAARIASSASSTRGSSSTIRTVVSSTGSPGAGVLTAARGRDRRLPEAEDLVEHLALPDALEARPAELATLHELIHLPKCLLLHDDMRVEEPCHPLDARGRDHRPPHHDQLAPPVGADRPRHHPARADPDADVEGGPAVGGPARGEPPDRGHHVERGPHRPQRDVRARLGHPEERDDLVAHQLLHRALVAEDHVDHLREVLVEQPDHHRRRRGLDQPGEAADVGEEHGRLAPVARGRRRSGLAIARSTSRGDTYRWSCVRTDASRTRRPGRPAGGSASPRARRSWPRGRRRAPRARGAGGDARPRGPPGGGAPSGPTASAGSGRPRPR